MKIKRPLVCFALAYIMGEILGIITNDKSITYQLILGIVLICMLIVIIPFLVRKNIIKNELKLVSFIVICMLFCGYLRYSWLDKSYKVFDAMKAGEYIEIEGEVYNVSESEYGKILQVKSEGFLYYCYTDACEVVTGASVRIRGKIKEMNIARNIGNYDEKSFLRANKVIGKIKVSNITFDDNDSNIVRGCLSKIRQSMEKRIDAITKDGKSGTLKALLLGDKSFLDEDVKVEYQMAGISHILAISALHIVAIGMFLFKLLRRVFSYYSSSVICGTFMVLFGLLTGNSVSTKRAVIMFVIALGAKILGRKYDSISALSIAVIVMLMDNPFYIYNTSFIMSVLAMLSITVVFKEWEYIVFEKKYGKFFDKHKNLKKISENLLCSICISVVGMPVVAYTYFELSTYSIFLNMLVIPLMSILLGAGLLAIVLSYIHVGIGVFIIGVDIAILDIYDGLCSFTNELWNNKVTVGKPLLGIVFLCYFCIFVFSVVMYLKRLGVITSNKSDIFLVVLCVFLICVFIYWPKRSDRIVFIDVGQGDCILVQASGYNVLIDGGSTDVSRVGKYRIIPALKALGISKLDVVFVSHTDKDHVSGILEMLDEKMIMIDKIFLKNVIGKYDSLNDFLKLANQFKKVDFMNEGDELSLGGAKFICLESNSNIKDINREAMVLLLHYNGYKAIFDGDITSDEEKVVCKRYGDNLGKINLFKATHHGSKYGNSNEILGLINPDVVVVSCGLKNKYGHPHNEALERFYENSCKVFRTDEEGELFFDIE